jgi:hypothetical protein
MIVLIVPSGGDQTGLAIHVECVAPGPRGQRRMRTVAVRQSGTETQLDDRGSDARGPRRERVNRRRFDDGFVSS